MATETKLDKNACAFLAENSGRAADDPWQAIEIQQREVFWLNTEPPELKERYFDLTIYSGEDDLTFCHLSPRKLCAIAEDLIRLAGGSLRVEAPADPEIKF